MHSRAGAARCRSSLRTPADDVGCIVAVAILTTLARFKSPIMSCRLAIQTPASRRMAVHSSAAHQQESARVRRSRQTSARCWARPEPVSWGYQPTHRTKHCDCVVQAGQRACRSCLSRQPYARKHVANHQGRSAGRLAAGSGVQQRDQGPQILSFARAARPAICVDKMPCPGSSQQHRSWHPLARGFGSMQGLTATPRRVNASRSLAFHLGSMSDSASAYRPHVSRIHPLHPENCNSPNTTRAARQ